MPTFAQFLSLAGEYKNLIIDLCIEQDVISRPQLLHYLEHHAILPNEKEKLIARLCRTAILFGEAEQNYTVNPEVMSLVNYYERRGQLTSAKFLRDRIIEITKLTDELQNLLFAEEKSKEAILDTLDDLYRLVREVREVGYNHYIACMRIFGNMKRTGDDKSIEQRLEELEIVQRQHISPLRELIDPTAEYAHKIESLRRRMLDLGAQIQFLAESQEVDKRRHRLNIDLQYIDHTLLRYFKIISNTALALLKSFLEEKNIKEAVAYSLGNLELIWDGIGDKTVLTLGRQFNQAPSSNKLEAFFADVIHRKLIPNPTPLSISLVEKEIADKVMIIEDHIWHYIEQEQSIESWPRFATYYFDNYSGTEQLKAIALPLIVPHPNIQINGSKKSLICKFNEFQIEMFDFGLTWKVENGKNITTSKQPGNLPETISRLPV